MNVDAWRVARVARDIATTGEYSVSRFPGYPLQEITCALFWRGGPWALNGLSAFFSAIAAIAFAGIARKLGCRDWFLAGLALAGTPVFFVSSACSKDYVWALAFALLSLLCALNRRFAIAGILVGLATGCRITSAAMMLPIVFVIFAATLQPWRALVKFVIAGSATALLAFLPAWFRYGTRFFTFYGNHPRPDWPTIINFATVEVWGGLGLIALAIAIIGTRIDYNPFCVPRRWIVVSLLSVILIYTAAYLRHPFQAGYLLPIVPAVLLLACMFTTRPFLRIALGCLVIASFVDLGPKGFRPGAILVDRSERIQNLKNIRDFLELAQAIPGNNVFVVGAWEPQIAVLAPHLVNGRNRYLYVMNGLEVNAALGSGASIYYLPAIREFNYYVNGLDLAQHSAHDFCSLLNPGLAPAQGP